MVKMIVIIVVMITSLVIIRKVNVKNSTFLQTNIRHSCLLSGRLKMTSRNFGHFRPPHIVTLSRIVQKSLTHSTHLSP